MIDDWGRAGGGDTSGYQLAGRNQICLDEIGKDNDRELVSSKSNLRISVQV